jgi:hypothetical protein
MIIRFIYVYREFATGRPVYVGSAFDVARRAQSQKEIWAKRQASAQ